MPLLRVTLSIGFPGAVQRDTIGIDTDEWEACTNDGERGALIDAYAQEWANDYIDIGAVILGDDDK